MWNKTKFLSELTTLRFSSFDTFHRFLHANHKQRVLFKAIIRTQFFDAVVKVHTKLNHGINLDSLSFGNVNGSVIGLCGVDGDFRIKNNLILRSLPSF